MPGSVTVVSHPLVQHKLSLLRQRQTGTKSFRNLLGEISTLLAYEATRDLGLCLKPIETPLSAMRAPLLEGKKLVLVSIPRAGNVMLDGMMQILPAAHVELCRAPETLEADDSTKLPDELGERAVIAVDPLLATGESAISAVERILALGPGSLKFVCLLAAPEGLARFHSVHPEVPVLTAGIDERLNDRGSILPGLGDAGARSLGTK